MLNDEQKKGLSRISIIDAIEFYGIEKILQSFDPLHIVVVVGPDEIYNALMRFYEDNKARRSDHPG